MPPLSVVQGKPCKYLITYLLHELHIKLESLLVGTADSFEMQRAFLNLEID